MEHLSDIEGFGDLYKKIDHVAIAVKDLESAIFLYQDILGFKLIERRTTLGDHSGMISAVLGGGSFTIVLIQGIEDCSQVSMYIAKYGPGVQHLALEVENIEQVSGALKEKGFDFATTVISGPGLRQIFSKRDENSGMMIELIERSESDGFREENINQLFNQLEESEMV